jgi:hypothetical protein
MLESLTPLYSEVATLAGPYADFSAIAEQIVAVDTRQLRVPRR